MVRLRTSSEFFIYAICLAKLLGTSIAYAADSTAPTLLATPTIWRVTTETLSLPNAEKMGMISGDLLFDVNDHVRLGAGTYGAIRGSRGGFITLGMEAEAHHRFAQSWAGHSGLFIGAGGGRGGLQLAGGGLMLRGDVGLTHITQDYGNFGFGISHVTFPSGVISSTQPYLQYELMFNSLMTPGWDFTTGAAARSQSVSTVEPHSSEFALVHLDYKIPRSAVSAAGQPQVSSMQLLGAEWTSYLSEDWFIKLHSSGAMGGQNNGYMQILAGGGYRLPLANGTSLKFDAAAGPAGGGNVDTGGGLLVNANMALQQTLGKNLAVELSLGEMRAPTRSFRARAIDVKLAYLFDLPSPRTSSTDIADMAGYDADRLRVRAANQTYFKASPRWRNQFVDRPVSNLGVQFDYFITPHWFASAQGLAAYAGSAGAYMTGMVGMGVHQDLSEHVFTEGEVLFGSAGGGGLAVGGGLVCQFNASLGYQLNAPLALSASIGRIKSATGAFQANVLGIGLSYKFTGFNRR